MGEIKKVTLPLQDPLRVPLSTMDLNEVEIYLNKGERIRFEYATIPSDVKIAFNLHSHDGVRPEDVRYHLRRNRSAYSGTFKSKKSDSFYLMWENRDSEKKAEVTLSKLESKF